MQDQDEVRRPIRRLEPLPLSPLGIGELQAYMVELQAEMSRVEADIARKGVHRRTADAFFKCG